MIPAVTVELRLYGFPTANTHSPTLRLFELSNLKRLFSPKLCHLINLFSIINDMSISNNIHEMITPEPLQYSLCWLKKERVIVAINLITNIFRFYMNYLAL